MSAKPRKADRTRHPLDLTPAEFARHLLKMPLYGWQEAILTDLDQPGAYSLRAANESGKTSTIFLPFILWFLTVFPRGTIVSTAGVYRQVRTQLFPKIRQLVPGFQGWECGEATLYNGRGGSAIGFRATDAGKFEGYHGSPSEPLAILVDEAKTVADDIFTAVARCRPQWLLMASSPGESHGEFYRSQTSQRQFYKCYKVTAYDCPHISAAQIERDIAKWGKDHWLVRSMIFAEFTRSEEAGAVVQLSDAERAIFAPPEFVPDDSVSAFCDFAAGGDENVVAVRRGNRVRVIAAWRERNTMAARDTFAGIFEREGLLPGQIAGDNGGLGTAMIDALAEVGWPISRFNFGAQAYDDSQFANRSAEIWNEFSADVRRGKWIIEDATDSTADDLLAQLSGRKSRRDSKGRLALESKEDMKGRGLTSPDRADAVIGACCNNPAAFRVMLI